MTPDLLKQCEEVLATTEAWRGDRHNLDAMEHWENVCTAYGPAIARELKRLLALDLGKEVAEIEARHTIDADWLTSPQRFKIVQNAHSDRATLLQALRVSKAREIHMAHALKHLAGPQEDDDDADIPHNSPVTIKCEIGDLRRAWEALRAAAKEPV